MAKEASTSDFNSVLTRIVAAIADARGPGLAPDLSLHIDSALPAHVPLPEDALDGLVRAAADWAREAGEDPSAALGFWRGGGEFDPGTDPGDLIAEFERRPLVPPAKPPEGSPSASPALETAASRLGGAVTAVFRARGGEIVRVRLPAAFPPDAAPGRAWGSAFDRRRVLIVREVIFDCRRVARSLAGVGLDVTLETDLDRGIAAAAEAAEAGRPHDLVILCRRLAGARLGEAVRRLRALPGGGTIRIVVTSALPEDARDPEIDGTIQRHGAWKRLLPLLFDLLRRPRGAPEDAQRAEVPSFAGYHILIAEDVAMNRALLQAMLAPTGVTYEVAADGAEAVEAMRRRPADLVLMDIQMPVMDGLEAARRIRAISAGVKVIALTANAREADRETYLAAGMNGYLAKPIRVDDLYAVLRRELG